MPASQMLLNSVGKEIFVMGSNIETPCICPFVASKKIQVLRNQLERIKAINAEEILVIHGVLTSAISIPNKLPAGVKAFVLIERPAKAEDSGYIIELDSMEQVISTIETLINKKDFIGKAAIADDLEDILFEVDKQQIEELFIVYGYSLKPTLYLPISAVSAEHLTDAKKVFEIVKGAQV